jgi:hypothetical protein
MTDHLQTGVNTMDNAMNSGTDLSLSADVRLLDDTRDETLKQFGGFLRGVMNHYIPEKASAATDIYNILSRHDFGAKKADTQSNHPSSIHCSWNWKTKKQKNWFPFVKFNRSLTGFAMIRQPLNRL